MPQLLAGLPDISTYAPRARVEVQETELAATSLADLLSVSVDLEIDNLAGFTLTFNNWDATNLKFKYSDNSLFDVGHTIHVQLGYADRVVSMVRGIITSLTPRFPEAGPPTIGVGGQDSMILLRGRKPSGAEQRKFTQKRDGEIAETIARRNGLTPKVDKTTDRNAEVYQRDLDELDFLMERAKRIDFDCYIANDPNGGKDELHFERPTDGREAQKGARVYQFEWGRNLINFNPQLTIARQVAQVTVRGWDPATKSVILGHADYKSLPANKGKGTSGPELVANRLRDKQDIVVDRPVHSKSEADELAVSILRHRAYDFVTGTGQCIGQPEMRPGDNLVLSGLGQRFDGEYFIKKTSHNFSSSGYLTDFEVRRIYDGSHK
jgi:phage protein D